MTKATWTKTCEEVGMGKCNCYCPCEDCSIAVVIDKDDPDNKVYCVGCYYFCSKKKKKKS